MARKFTLIGMVPPSILKARAAARLKKKATARKPFKKAKASGLKKKKGRPGN